MIRGHTLHRIVVDSACPPCTGACNQGRQCSAHMPAEACTEIGAEPSERDRGAAARFWVRYLLVVAVACIAGAVAWMR